MTNKIDLKKYEHTEIECDGCMQSHCETCDDHVEALKRITDFYEVVAYAQELEIEVKGLTATNNSQIDALRVLRDEVDKRKEQYKHLEDSVKFWLDEKAAYCQSLADGDIEGPYTGWEKYVEIKAEVKRLQFKANEDKLVIEMYHELDDGRKAEIEELKAALDEPKLNLFGRLKNERAKSYQSECHAARLKEDVERLEVKVKGMQVDINQGHFTIERYKAHAVLLAGALDNQLTLCSEAALGTMIGDSNLYVAADEQISDDRSVLDKYHESQKEGDIDEKR